ncbi:MAG TPA: archease [Terriglobales bacterium]|nr:archease [Terriglobales bacterium]
MGAPSVGSEPPFRELEHTADRAFVVRAPTLPELFVRAAQGLFSLGAAVGGAAPSITRTLEVSGADLETMLVNWLNELLYLQEAHGETYTRFEIHGLYAQGLRATIYGAPCAGARRVIKAVTFHGLKVERSADGWEAVFVVDV